MDDEGRFRARVAALSEQFEVHQLTVEYRPDASWRFYERYRKDFAW